MRTCGAVILGLGILFATTFSANAIPVNANLGARTTFDHAPILAHHKPGHKLSHWNRGRHYGWIRGKHKGWYKRRYKSI
jgi:hypothetical protein